MTSNLRVATLMILAILSISFIEAQTDLSQLTAVEIVDRVDRMLRGDSSRGTMQMTVKTRRWERQMTLEIWSEGTEKALVKVLRPKKEEGVTTLKVNSDMWNYLPKIDRTIRIPTSMMMASWMGSHFTNDDLVKESRLIHDYDIELSYQGKREELPVWEFTLTPHPDAPVVWGKIHYQVRKQDLMPTWVAYYGEDGERKRTLIFSDYREFGGRLVPARSRMIPEDEPEEFTEINYLELQFDVSIPRGTFSLASLRR
ncbi:MAG: outer membrane lipoprotein-sorting protein [Acidobacteriota bacterium]